MMFPLSFWDINALIALAAIILLATSELLSISYGKVTILISKKRLRRTAIAFSIFFIISVAINIAGIVLQT
jgi:hypothetical protein